MECDCYSKSTFCDMTKLTVTEKAAQTGLKERWVQQLCRDGRWSPPAKKSGRDWLIPATAKVTAAAFGPKSKATK